MWKFSESIPAERRERLLSYADFSEIALLLADARPIKFIWEPYDNTFLKGCHRASFLLEVSSPTYDAFFNSPVGYRGEYAASISRGEAANSQLIRQLENSLLKNVHNESINLQLIQKSLRAEGAKIWIYEREVEKQLGRDKAEILYPPWQDNSSTGVGLLAPVGNKLVVCGGWLDSLEQEQLNPAKSSRSLEIHTSGYS